MAFEYLMNVLQQICEGEMTLYDLVNIGGFNIPTHVYTWEDDDGHQIDEISYEFENATADRETFTEAQCKELDEAYMEAFWSVKDYEDMCDSALVDWNS